MNLGGNVFTYDNLLVPDLKALQTYVHKLSFECPSFVYNRRTETDIQDKKVRNSYSVMVDDESLMRYVQDLLLQIAKQPGSENLVVKLARDHVTVIKYLKDGFFDWHQDFEKIIVNDRHKWIEMHLILCIQGADGGELLVRTGDTSTTYEQSTGRCILFDKSLEHRGNEVRNGIKIIMTVDVLVSTSTVQNPLLNVDLEIEPCINTGCMSYEHNAIQTYVDNDMIVFCYLHCHRDDDSEITIIYDSIGLYYINMTYKDETYNDNIQWIRGEAISEHIEHIIRLFNQGTTSVVSLLVTSEVTDIVSGTINLPKLTIYNPIPEGTAIDVFKTLNIIHRPTTPPDKISYLYHCNEPSYGTTSIQSLLGFLPKER
jgi:predicted 2-oxoglutarate/Fe(II)-dependent dioxygenase YbiX